MTKFLHFFFRASLISVVIGTTGWAQTPAKPDLKIPSTFSKEEQAYIISNEEVERRPEETFRMVYVFEAALRARLEYNSGKMEKDIINAEIQNALLNPLSREALQYQFFGPQVPKNEKEAMEWAAKRAYEYTSNPVNLAKERERYTDLLMGATALGFSVAGAPALAAGSLNLGYQFLKQEEMAYFEKIHQGMKFLNVPNQEDVGSLALTRLLVTDSKSEIGQILSPYFKKLSDQNLKLDPKYNKWVMIAEMYRKTMKEKGADGAFQDLDQKQKITLQIQGALSQVKNGLKQPELGASARRNGPRFSVLAPSDANASKGNWDSLEVEKSINQREKWIGDLQNAGGTLRIFSYVASLSGDYKAARTFSTLSEMCVKSADLLEKAASQAPMALAAGWVGVGMMAVSLIAASQEPASPFPAIFEALKQISKQIEDLRLELRETLARMDNRLGNLLEQSLILSEATLENTDALKRRVNEIQDQLQKIQSQTSREVLSLAAEVFREQDRACFPSISGAAVQLPLDRLVNCRDQYIERVTETSRGALSEAKSLNVSEWARLFPYSGVYRQINEKRPDALSKRALPDPDLWFDSTSRLLSLALHQKDFFKTIEVSEIGNEISSATLDPLIEAGQEIRDFLLSVTSQKVEKSDKREMNRSLFLGFGARIQTLYRQTLNELSKVVANPGINLDATKSASQSPRYGHGFPYFIGNNVRFAKDARPQVESLIAVTATQSSGAHGTSEIWSPANQPCVCLRDRLLEKVDASYARQDLSTLQPDRSILPAIDPRILNYEQVNNGRTRIEIQKYALQNLNYQSVINFSVRVDLKFRVLATFSDGSEKVVQELAGQYEFGYNYPNPTYVFSVDTFRGHIFAFPIRDTLAGKYGSILKTVSSSEVKENLRKLESDLNQTILAKRNSLLESNRFPAIEAQLTEMRNQLYVLGLIGLNRESRSTWDFLELIRNQRFFPTIETLSKRVFLEGGDFEKVQDRLAESQVEFQLALNRIEQDGAFIPDTRLIDARLEQLQRLKELKAKKNREAARAAAKKKK